MTRKQVIVTVNFENHLELLEWIDRARDTKWGCVRRSEFIRTVLKQQMEAIAKD